MSTRQHVQTVSAWISGGDRLLLRQPEFIRSKDRTWRRETVEVESDRSLGVGLVGIKDNWCAIHFVASDW